MRARAVRSVQSITVSQNPPSIPCRTVTDLIAYSVKKPKQEESFDPAVVAAVEAKLRALGVDEDPPTSEPEHL